jgi:hypothetical protein
MPDNDKARHSSSRKRLIERKATISACQSWRTEPLAMGILHAGRHFIPVLEMSASESYDHIDRFKAKKLFLDLFFKRRKG